MPYGEWEHGLASLLDDYQHLLGTPDAETAGVYFPLPGLKKRVANKVSAAGIYVVPYPLN